ncbi:MAG: site-specific DNA-methyltransferase [Planctomycetes bacterium]|nr:site-specific DNA-methyltransferase [Planctomycetota bacterium]
MKRTKLELTWIGKENRPRLEPRILLEDPEKSYHAKRRVTTNDQFDNRLIFGDNLLALKALEQEFAGKIKCIFIDPPYNTGSAFEHYDDGVEHSIWLSLMRDRLEIIGRLLSEDGSLWITIDDNEAHYLKVLCDEVYGRANFVANIVWQKRYSPDARIAISDAHEHLLCYAIDPSRFKKLRNLIPLSEQQTKQFKNPDNDPRGPWKADNFTAAGYRPNQMYSITLPSGRSVTPSTGRCWRVTIEGFEKFTVDKRMYYGPNGDSLPSLKRYLAEMAGMVPWSWWPHTEVGHSQEAKKESYDLFGADAAFSTPKPERLLYRILQVATNFGDIVLDSFAGSGTTGAVAHKMGRRWIMVELGEHCHTHIIPRLKKVVDGDDPGGITEAVGWKGGGGFRYYRLAPSLLEKDSFGNWVIRKNYNAAMLAESVCKLMGYRFTPSETVYWQHGQSTERDFIYVTTQSLNRSQLAALSEEVGPGRTLLVCCSAFRVAADAFENLTLKKIPKAVLDRCEWGRDDYSLSVSNLPPLPEPDPDQDEPDTQGHSRKGAKKKSKGDKKSATLFGEGGGG